MSKSLAAITPQVSQTAYRGGPIVFNGAVRATHYDQANNILYIGGDFTSVEQPSRYHVRFAPLTTSDTSAFSRDFDVNGAVRAVVDDGASGFYLAGEFTSVNGVARNYLAHINSSGDVTSWNPSANGFVDSMAKNGDNIYFGGAFTSIAGQSRSRIALVNTAGSLDSWSPSANGDVEAITVFGNNIYFGGRFAVVNDTIRPGVAALNTAASLLNWNPRVDGNVHAITTLANNVIIAGNFSGPGADGRNFIRVSTNAGATPLSNNVTFANGAVLASLPDGSGGTYIGGSFTSINGETRHRLAHINSSGLLTSWNPSANSTIHTLGMIGSNIYIGGDFTSIAATNIAAMAVVNTSGSLQSFNINVSISGENARVSDLEIYNSNIYFVGRFAIVSGQARSRLAAVNTTGSLLAWNPNASGFTGTTYCISRIGDNIYLGGEFTLIGGIQRFRAAAVNTAGSLLTWNPSANNNVFSIATIGDNIYLGGQFTSIASTSRNYLAAFNQAGGIQTWNPSANAIVRTVSAFNTNVYFGGDFTSVATTSKSYSACVNTAGSLLTWGPSSTNSIGSITIDSTLSVVDIGSFSNTSYFNLTNTNTNKIWVDATTGTISASSFAVSNAVHSMTTIGDNLYIAGDFTVVGPASNTRNRLMAINSTGSLQAWDPNADNTVTSISAIGTNLYFGGTFTTVAGQTRTRLAMVDTNGSIQAWAPCTAGNVSVVQAFNSRVYVGSNSTIIANADPIVRATRNRVAAINFASGQIASWDPNVNGNVHSIAQVGNNIYLGGAFTSVGSTTRNRLASVNTSGSLLSWDPNANGSVNQLKTNGFDIYAVGEFTSIASTTRERFAVVNTAGSIQSAKADFTNNITAIHIDGSNVYTGGEFSSINSSKNGIAFLNTSTGISLFASRRPEANGFIRDAVSDGSGGFYICGNFTSVNGQARNYLAHINSSGEVTAWNPGSDYSVNCIERIGFNLYFGGYFFSVAGQYRNCLAAVNTSGSLLAWNPSASSEVFAVKALGNNLYFGYYGYTPGGTASVASTSRVGAFAINTAGSLLAWNPNLWDGVVGQSAIYGSVYAIDADINNNIYLGGYFLHTGGNTSNPRNYVAAFNTGGSVLSWNPGAGWYVEAIEVSGTNVYIGGMFSAVAGQPRNHIALVNTSGSLQTWNPSVGPYNYGVWSIAASGTNVHIGGQISTIGGQSRFLYGIVNTNGDVVSTNLNFGGSNQFGMGVRKIIADGENAFIAGYFDFAGGSTRSRIAMLNTAGSVQSWNPSADGPVFGIDADGGNVYIGGSFTSISGTARNRLAMINSSGAVTSWDPNVNGNVHAIVHSGANVYIAGNFTTINSASSFDFAVVNTSGSLVVSNVISNAFFGGTIFSLAESDSSIVLKVQSPTNRADIRSAIGTAIRKSDNKQL